MWMRWCLGLLVIAGLTAGLTACGGGGEATPAVCGDGEVGGDEQCDDGNLLNLDGCSATCRTEATTCGNGDVDVATETCDDGNTESGDGCSRLCQTECGNGGLDGAEACDDGNLVAGDGCGQFCDVEPDYTCTGEPSDCITPTGTCMDPYVLPLMANGAALEAAVTGDTTMATDQVPAGPCDGSTSGAGPDHLWKLTLPDTRDVQLTIAAGTTFDSAIRLLGIACDPASEVPALVTADGCADGAFGNGAETLRYTALPAGTYFVVVDGGAGNESGMYYLNVSATPSVCGDGLLANAERCDDGNTTMNDGCSATCDVEPGYACTGTPSVCGSACGSGTLEAGEECDDSNTAPGDRCSSTCTLEFDIAEVEPNNTTAQVVTASNHIIRGALTAADVDLYTFTLPGPATVTIETYNAIDGAVSAYTGRGMLPMLDCVDALDTVLRLFDATGNVAMNTGPIAFDDEDGDGSCSYLGPNDAANPMQGRLPAGTYTLRVANYSSAAVANRYLIDLNIAVIVPVPPVAGDLVINEVMANDATADTNCDGDTTGATDEFVELVNVSSKLLDLSGVTLSDAVGVKHTFPAGVTVEPGKAYVVWSGGAPACPGLAAGSFAKASTGSLQINNDVDTVTIKVGTATVAQAVISGSTTGVSRNRNPDVTGAGYAHHYEVPGAMGGFSPGKRASRAAF